MVNFCRFTCEKIFTVAVQVTPRTTACTLQSLFARKTSQLIVFSALGQHSAIPVGVSALGRTNLHFVDPRVKVNGQYYRDILRRRDFLPDIKQYSDYFTFQQDGAPAHRALETVELPKVELPNS